MGASVGNAKGPMAEINVTPLIDVVLVLLVVFMVVTPMLSSGLPVDLPLATTTTTVNDAGQHIVISFALDGKVAVDQEILEPEANLTPEEWKSQVSGFLLSEINKIYREKSADWAKCPSEDNCGSILVKADGNHEYGRVRPILDILSENRFTAVFLAAGKEK